MTFRPKRFTAANMRHRITLQTATEAADGAGQMVQTWANTLTGEPADYTPTIGGEVLRGKQVEAGISAVFIVRFRESTYTPQQRIVFDGTNYGIVHVRPVDGGRRYIELHCKA